MVNHYATTVTSMAVGLLVLAMAGVVYQLQPPPKPGPVPVWFYDLNTGQLFTAKSDAIPPIPAPSDGRAKGGSRASGARAHVFSCGDCAAPAERFVGYLEIYTPEAKKALETLGPLAEASPTPTAEKVGLPYEKLERGHLIRRPPEAGEKVRVATRPAERGARSGWVPLQSEAGFALQQEVAERCGEDTFPEPCRPKDAAGE